MKIKKSALTLVPNIPFDKTIRTFSGLRVLQLAMILLSKKVIKLRDLLMLQALPHQVLPLLRNRRLCCKELVGKHLTLKEKVNFNPRIKNILNQNN